MATSQTLDSTKYILGLDCGTNSLGWACVTWNPSEQTSLSDDFLGHGKILDAGARVFPEAVEKKTGASKNLARRQKRGMRKNLRQRRWRRDQLLGCLVEWKWMPSPSLKPDELAAFYHDLSQGVDPYQLRAEGLTRPLTLPELSRILLHMVKRRGFQSNRKSKGPDEGKVLSSIKRVSDEIARSGHPTLGAFLHDRRSSHPDLPLRNRAYLDKEAPKPTKSKDQEGAAPITDIYTLFTQRSMYADELAQLWTAQQAYFPAELTPERLKLIQRFVLEQRPLKVARHLVGNCPHVEGEKRAPMAYLQCQEARILATLNTLRVMNPDPNAPRQQASRPLSEKERGILCEALQTSSEVEWGRARRLLGLHDRELFNIEAGGRAKRLKGNTTVHAMLRALPAVKSKRGKSTDPTPEGYLAWNDLYEEEQQAIIKTLVYEDHEGKAAAYIAKHTRLSQETATQLASRVLLEEGHFAFSIAALEQILPQLRAFHPDRLNTSGRSAPMLGMTEAILAAGFSLTKQYQSVPQLPLPPDLRNPVVNKALFQVRKIVNAVIRKHGLPAKIRIELARDIKRTKAEREEVDKEMAKRDARRAAIRPLINKMLNRPVDAIPKTDEYLRYELWEECGKVCPYSLRPIGAEHVFSPEIQIEHIIPWSRCFDDSRGNKTLCFWKHNQCKGRQTPREAYAESLPAHYEQICQHVRHCVETCGMKRGKAARFEWTDVELVAGSEEFTNRHLSDTRYLSRAIHDYLKQLNPDPDTLFVQVAKGDTTSVLRHYWGLTDSAGTPASGCVIPPLTSDVSPGGKNRDDHRHHTVDAIVVALTTPAMLQFLSRRSGQQGRESLYDGRLHLPKPWDRFRDSVRELIAGVVVSHDPTRKAKGGLHLETGYGSTSKPGEYVQRIPIESLTVKDLDPAKGCVRDPSVAELLRKHLQLHGGNPKTAFSRPVFQPNGVTRIRKVRITASMKKTRGLYRDGDLDPYRFVEFGSNHHVVILSNLETGKWEERIVTLMEAAERSSKGQPIIQRQWGPGFEIVCVLQVNDMVEITDDSGRNIYRVQQLSARDYVFRRHNVARVDGELKEAGRIRICSTSALENLNLRQIDVTPLGEVVSRG